MSETRETTHNRFRSYMLFPLVLFLAAFLLDKLFFIGNFPSYFMNTASFVNYEHKEVLVDELEEYLKTPNRKMVLVMFGNSRTMAFDNNYIESHYPGVILFNFSVPGGTSDFYLYYMEKFQKRNIHPDFIFFTLAPQGFNTTPGIAMDEVLIFGLPAGFFFRHLNRYSSSEVTNYIAKNLFWSYKHKPRPGRILRRFKNNSDEKNRFDEFVSSSREEVERERGSVPHDSSKKPSHEHESALVENARSSFRTFLYHFNMSEGQLRFTEDSLRIAREMGIDGAVVWARVAPELRRLIDEEKIPHNGDLTTVRDLWEGPVRSLSEKYGYPFVDLNTTNQFHCDQFYDASHMAGYCFPAFTDFLIHGVVQKDHLEVN